MKKTVLSILTLVMTSLCATASDTWVMNSEGDFIWYDFNEKEKTARVTFKGNKTSSGRLDYINDITIPSTVEYEGELYSVTSIGKYAFSDCDKLFNVTVPNSVTSIGRAAFNNCRELVGVNIPNNVTKIDVGTFSGCEKLSSIIIPNGVTSIGIAAFSNCRNLTEVVMPSELTSIGQWAFCGCHRLKEVIIPWRVTTIDDEAFYNCDSLSSITVLNTTPPKLVLYANEQIPRSFGESVSVYVPAESVEKYKTAEGWKQANIKDLSQKAEKKELKVKNSADAGKAEFLTDFLMILLIITFVFVFLLLRKKNA